LWSAAIALVVLLGFGATAQAGHLFSDVAGHTTLERVITGADPSSGFATLSSQSTSGSHLVRDGASEATPEIPNAQAGRADRRRSLSYVGQLTDFQLADEESPARVEFTDQEPTGFAASAWRPQEALQPFIIDWSIRQMNLFSGASPVAQSGGDRAAMDFTLVTGDQADNMQRNEMLWVRGLLEGGATLDPNSGSQNPLDWSPLMHPSCAAYPANAANLAEAAKYTGVQDYDDYDEGPTPYFYDPDNPQGYWQATGWPAYPGLMDRAQLPFTPAGLNVPSYVTNGNHDGLVQGNEDGNAAFEDIATGCFKALGSTSEPLPGQPPDGLDPSVLLTPSSAAMLVPPDPLRRFVDKKQTKAIYAANGEDNSHGYDFVDEDEEANSAGGATYYAWDPPEAPGVRYISIDTLSEGGVVEQSSNGNIDNPQFQWLERELEFAQGNDKLVMVFGHHPIRSLNSNAPDEAAGPCAGVQHSHGDGPEHDLSPGCDIDPRASAPIHYGEPSQRPPGSTDETLSQLFARFPNVLAYIAGHTHENNVQAFPRTGGGGGVWWGIETSATADWPVQHRLIELMDNRDGTLSLFGTVLDAASSGTAPAPGSAAAFDEAMLSSLGREFAYNDPQAGSGSGEGAANDQNVELLVKDPRRADLELTKTDNPDPVNVGDTLTYTLNVRNYGRSAASGVTLTDMLPPSVAYVSATPSQGTCTQAAGTVTCDLGYIEAEAVATVTIAVTPLVAGTIVNQANVNANQADPRPQNNSDTENTTVQAVAGGYARPKGASPLHISVVPAYQQCLSPNRTHGAPLSSPSCAPPVKSSASLTVGTPDANGRASNSTGSVELRVLPGDLSTPADEADVAFALNITDVRRQSDLADYTGGVQGSSILRITDRWSGSPGPGGSDSATVVDLTFPLSATCTATASPDIGSTCSLNTTFDAVVPGALAEGRRAIWQFGQFVVTDGGSDGNVSTSPNTVFARQGIFVP
jgi:uncharacterized repeat protein (TIGR01451 family)